MGLWARRVTEFCKQRLRGHPSRSMECGLQRAMWALDAQVKKLQRGTILTTG